jgi:hypothetical protein
MAISERCGHLLFPYRDRPHASVGEALFGPHREGPTSLPLLASTPRTVRRWLSGTEEPPAGVWVQLLAIAVKRLADLRAIMPELERRVGDR